MTFCIQQFTLLNVPFLSSSFFSELQEKTSQVFFKLGEVLFPDVEQPIAARAIVDLGAIARDPGQLIEGGIWGLWWAAGVHFLKGSVEKLYSVITAEDSGNEKFEKICLAAKAVFVDAMSLASSTLYVARWADGASIISLGRYLPLVKHLCYGTSFAIHTTELIFEGRQFCAEVKSLLWEQHSFLFQQRFQRVIYLSMKLISNISMVAWAALGIASLVGFAMNSVLMPSLLAVGCVAGLSAIGYRMKNSISENFY